MFSLELRNTLPAPPGLSSSIADATSLFSALCMEELSKVDGDYFKSKEKPSECLKCNQTSSLCDKLFSHKQKVLSCLVDTFNLVQKESVNRIRAEKELEELKNEKIISEEMSGPYRKIRTLMVEIKKKEKIVNDLILENRELCKNRVYVEKLSNQLRKEIALKNDELLEEKNKKCKECFEKEKEIKGKVGKINELQENLQVLNCKVNELFRVSAEKEILTQKIISFAEIINLLPDINGRELRMSIHKQICDIETDFIELSPNQQSFETIKEKYLQLPYLLKPIFDLTKQFEKSISELRKLFCS
jgi:hypothetical protein